MKFQIHYFDEVPSTNSTAQEFAGKGAGDGTVITADFQTQGRGKPGRKWISSAGKNLLFSLLLRPPIPVNHAPIITQIACRSVSQVLKDHYKISSRLKRPNDVLVKGKKICGILVESSCKSSRLENVVIGIGLNVNSDAAELLPTATSLSEIKGKELDRGKLLKRILNQLGKDLAPLYASRA